MSDPITISVDAMGGDFAPRNVVSGCVQASKESDVQIILVGIEEQLRVELSQHPDAPDAISIVDASEVVTMNDQATVAVRKKKNSSMRVAVDLAAGGKAHAIISAGNTGAMYAVVKFRVGVLPGVDRLPPLPSSCRVSPRRTCSTACLPRSGSSPRSPAGS